MNEECPKCQSEHRQIQRTPDGPHYAKEVCAGCGKYFRWIPNPDRKRVLHRFFMPIGVDEDDPEDYECVFGNKHYKERLSEIALDDPEWLEWILENDFPQEVHNFIESIV